MLALISDLPDGGLEWQAGDSMASIAGIASHILLVEDYALHAVSGASLTGWSGTNGQDMDRRANELELRSRILELDGRAKGFLCEVSEQALLARHDGNGRTVFDVLVEEMDHAAMHYGHMQLARQLYEQAHPEFVSEYKHWW